MKVLVLGGTGMVGHTISIYFKEVGHDVTVFSRKKFRYCQNINGDVLDFERLIKIVQDGDYDAIVNAIGILNQNAEENKPIAVLINSYLPHLLSEITKDIRTKIIHISTDCVFSGVTGGYIETSFRDGESFYDRTKALGEIDNTKDLTFRSSIVGPDMNKNGIGLFNWFMKQDSQINGYTKAIWTGVTSLTLARAIEHAISENISGVYNLVNNANISKYELLILFNKYMKENQIKILPNDTIQINKSLINSRKDFSFIVPSYEFMIIEMKKWIEMHQEIYSHY